MIQKYMKERIHHYTLPVFIRNAIDHPDSERIVEDADLDISISLLRDIYKHVIEEKRMR